MADPFAHYWRPRRPKMEEPPQPLVSVPHFQRDHEIWAFISIMSGSKGALEYYEKMVKPRLSSKNIHIDKDHEHVTTSADSITGFTRSFILPRAVQGKKQTIILLSGDGGIVDVLNGIQLGLDNAIWECKYHGEPHNYVRPVICLIPMGTGNALAYSSGLETPDDALSTALEGTGTPLPTFRVRFSEGARLLVDEGRDKDQLLTNDGLPTLFGAVVCSWGLHASLVHMSDTAEYRQHGVERFQMAAKKLGDEGHRYHGIVSILTKDLEVQDEQAEMDSDTKPPEYGGSSHATAQAKEDNAKRYGEAYGRDRPRSMSEEDEEIDRGARWKSLSYASRGADVDNSERTMGNAATEHAYVLTTFVSDLQKGFTISPLSQKVDSELRLVAFPPLPRERTEELFRLAFHNGSHVYEDEVLYEPVQGVRVDMDEDDAKWRVVCVDGKIVEVEKDGWFEVKKMVGRDVLDLVV